MEVVLACFIVWWVRVSRNWINKEHSQKNYGSLSNKGNMGKFSPCLNISFVWFTINPIEQARKWESLILWAIYVHRNQTLRLPNTSINSTRPTRSLLSLGFRRRNERRFALFLAFPSRVTDGVVLFRQLQIRRNILWDKGWCGGFLKRGKWNWIFRFTCNIEHQWTLNISWMLLLFYPLCFQFHFRIFTH